MPSTRDIRRRIKSVKSTAQITKAMQLVAASKMKKAQDQATAGRYYSNLINKVLVNLKERVSDESHVLLEERTGEKEILLLVTTDKGLCGGLNTNLIRKALDVSGPNTTFVTVGRKGCQSLGRLKKDLIADFPVSDPTKFSESKAVSKFVMEKFLENPEIGRVRVAFTNFITTLTQTPTVETLLPINPMTLGRVREYEGMGGDDKPESADENFAGYSFEPSASVVFDTVLPQYVNNQFFQMLLESRASEHSSRMVAMKSATDNAKQLIKDLTLEYNKLRQASITNELLEITTAMKALE
ncbi:MAG: ATP synthase F1 subunit gamma [Verrucomicrobia bacterium]|nr:ATP synthase F1 subunit gamma [Verrucomicrobiota bacterium]